MKTLIEEFLAKIDDIDSCTQPELIELVVYFLTVEEIYEHASLAEIMKCFATAHISMNKSTVWSYLQTNSKSTKARKAIFIRSKKGYSLVRSKRLEMQTKYSTKRTHRSIQPKTLSTILAKLPEGNRKDFLSEAVTCYEVNAFRGAIVLTWIVVLDHLYEFILRHHLKDFVSAIAKHPDKRINKLQVTQRDHFSEIPEGQFIELCRSAKMISNDVRKILDTKLGIRNTYAHPSTIQISEVKTADFIQDLVDNVLLKYQI